MNTISSEHEDFLKRKIKLKRKVIFVQLLILVSLLSIWEFLAANNYINNFLFSSPTNIFSTIFNMIKSSNFITHLGITFYELLISFILSLSLGIIISILLWWFPFISKVLDPYIMILNSLPKVALGPLIIIWFGAGIKSIVFMSLMISLFVTIIDIYTLFLSVPDKYILLLKSFNCSKYQLFRYLIFPYSCKSIMSVLKVNLSLNFIGVIMGELLVSKKGIGYLIMYGSQIFNINIIITCVFVLGLLSYFVYYFINKIK